MDVQGNVNLDYGQRLAKFTNLTLDILRTEPSIIIAEDVLYGTFVTMGCISNIVLFLVIFKSRKELLQFPSNILLFNLAIANLASLSTSALLKIYSRVVETDPALSNMTNKAASILTECELLLSNWTVTTLAIFSFLGVISPIKFRTFITRKKTLIVISVTWAFAIGLILPLILSANPREIFINGQLSPEYYTPEINIVTLYVILDVLSKAPPLLSILTLYPAIFVTLRLRLKESGRSEYFRVKLNQSIAHVTNIYIVFILYISLDICVSISFYWFLFSDILDKPVTDSSYSFLKIMAVVLIPFQIFHTILNPLLHALSTENYRKYYLPLLCKHQNMNDGKSTEGASKISNKLLNHDGPRVS